jgi:hypothetical protein
MVEAGSKVTLRSLLPEATSTLRVSAFQLEFGMETTTVCVPTARLMLIGVTLPVSTPSTATLAPDGNEVTFSAPLPLCAPTLLGTSKRAPANTIIQAILLGWFIEPSLNVLTVQLSLRQPDAVYAYFRGNT